MATAGVAWFPVSWTVAVAVVWAVVSIGVSVTDSECVPAVNTVPEAGMYTKLPAAIVRNGEIRSR
jgi:hypothetical protein